MTTIRSRRSTTWLLLAGVVLAAGGWRCQRGGGGGASGGSGGDVVLVGLELPDPSNQQTGTGGPPSNCSLVQQVVYRFDGPPRAAHVHSKTLPVLDSQGTQVSGEYAVRGVTVVFTPDLPLTSTAIQQSDFGGLRPGITYTISVTVNGSDSMPSLRAIDPALLQEWKHPSLDRAILASFSTTTNDLQYFTGLEVRPVTELSLVPEDGTRDLAPFLYTDPDQVFGPNRTIELLYDAPLHPDAVTDLDFRLVDMDHVSGSPVELGVIVTLVENRAGGARVTVQPSGILPFGHMLALEVLSPLRHLSDFPPATTVHEVRAVYQTPSAPATLIRDRYEVSLGNDSDFDAEQSRLRKGYNAAEWNRQDSGVLQAAGAFVGTGVLGRFQPAAEPGKTTVITLDTNRQPFPLLNGATPDARPGTVVQGGVFHFTDINIPSSVVLRPLGQNALVFVATGSVRIAGTVDLDAGGGASDQTYDSAVNPVPGGRGGPGGGRGGESCPTVYFPPTQFQLANLISATFGASGEAPQQNAIPGMQPPQGGRGGPAAILDDPAVPNPEISCAESNVGSNGGGFGGGGGGGSLQRSGTAGRVGSGNMMPLPNRTWIDSWPNTSPAGGLPGTPLFPDADSTNNFIGPDGEVHHLQGGQGGGGGGVKAEGYHCGRDFPWGLDEFRGVFPDRVGDARGGGGGGGAGAFEVFARGDIVLASGARIQARGGPGGGGEQTGSSIWGGPGGGGSAGIVVLKSTSAIDVLAGAVIDVTGGPSGNGRPPGVGGDGLVGLRVPVNSEANMVGTILPDQTVWTDRLNRRNPIDITPFSQAVSHWIDLGQTIHRPPSGAQPRYLFRGIDLTGRVVRLADGRIPTPELNSFRIGYLGLLDPVNGTFQPGEEPRADWLPPSAEVVFEFQAADAVAEGSREVDLTGASDWMPDPMVADGRQFLRWRVTFDIAADGSPLDENSRRPVVECIHIDTEF